jgi:hypothetical protein
MSSGESHPSIEKDERPNAGKPALSRGEIESLKLGECYSYHEERESWNKVAVSSQLDCVKLPALFVSAVGSSIIIKALLRPTALEYREPNAPPWGHLSSGLVYIIHRAEIDGDILTFSPTDRFLKSGCCRLTATVNVYVAKEYVVERPWFLSWLRRRYRVVVEASDGKHVVMRGLLPGMAHALKRVIAQECWAAA